MTYWPWYVGGGALAAVMIGHYLAMSRMMAVSGRYTALVNRLRFGRTETVSGMSQEQLIAAMRAATAEAFGADALDAPPVSPPPATSTAPAAPASPTATHVLFLVGLVAGGLVSALLRGGFSLTTALRGDVFARVSHGSPIVTLALLFGGGLLVGFGTRMAGGCTSGHGLCGMSRLQPGSCVATVAFFGVGVATSFALGRLG